MQSHDVTLIPMPLCRVMVSVMNARGGGGVGMRSPGERSVVSGGGSGVDLFDWRVSAC